MSRINYWFLAFVVIGAICIEQAFLLAGHKFIGLPLCAAWGVGMRLLQNRWEAR